MAYKKILLELVLTSVHPATNVGLTMAVLIIFVSILMSMATARSNKMYALILPPAMDTRILQLQMEQQGIRSMVSSKVECVN